MRLSLILPVYNDAAGARRALMSVGKLPFEHEILLADDGSEPAEAQALSRLREEFPSLRLLTLPHGGVGAARQAALEAARGDRILFLDGDDTLYPDSLPRALAFAEKTEADVVLFGYGYVQGSRTAPYLPPEEGVFSPEEFAAHLSAFAEADQLGQVWGKLFARRLVTENGLRFPAEPWGEDRLFLHRALASARRIAASSLLLYRYAPREGGLCRRYLEEKPPLCVALHRSLTALFARFGKEEEARGLCRKVFLKGLLSHGASLYSHPPLPRRRRREEGRRLLETARLVPSAPAADGTHRLLEWVFERKSPLPLLILGHLSHLLRARLPAVFCRAAHGKHRTK
ncbi:MAG: glycosyltransferase family 2 protein [Clostridia bacterium]|nr:glycosyltransferase family 2 protein [Clostridia bacterium]